MVSPRIAFTSKKLFDMGAFDIVDTPPDKKVMEGVFSFKTKYDSEGNVLKYAARGNVNGSKQEPGTFGDTFAPTGTSSVTPWMGLFDNAWRFVTGH